MTLIATDDTSCHQFGSEAAGRDATRYGKIDGMIVGPGTDDTRPAAR